MTFARLASGLVLASSLALGLAGCAREQIADKEDMLAAAGFRSRIATTPEQMASLQALPPHKFVRQVRNGQQVWVYADPTVCRCVYAGNEQAWQTYRRNVFQQRLADEQSMTASMNENAMMWGAWGPGPWWY